MLKVKQLTTICDILLNHSMTHPDRLAFTYLGDGISPSQTLTYQDLQHQAQAICHHLQTYTSPGNRALLMLPPGLEFISALFGCLYAGVIAVPIPELDPLRAKRNKPRLHSILSDSQATVLLTTKKLFGKDEEKQNEEISKLGGVKPIFLEDVPLQSFERRDKGTELCNEIAFLQYTSGSTAAPKGVMVTQDCLIQQLNALKNSCRLNEESISLNWMPHFHDYGLVNGLLLNVYLGTHSYQMAPTRFLRNPLLWLQAITKYQVTHSSGPNFAYDLCVTKIEAEKRVGLNLRKWCFASCGAEPIRVETMNRFFHAFEPWGFKKQSFSPAYGLAEFTLAATITPQTSPPTHLELDGKSFEKGIIAPTSQIDPDTRKIVCCGPPIQETNLRIIDEKTHHHAPQGRIGEIWLAGPSVTKGYWQNTEETLKTFNAFTADTNEGPFLRTGDLGFLRDGLLYVTGRLKDLIIIRGHNYFPQDIEQTVQESHRAFQQGATAAFSVPEGSEEQLVVVQELRQHKSISDFEHLASIIRQAVSQQHNLPVYGTILVKTGSIPKTTSGKIQRQACREAFLTETLTSLHASFKQTNTDPFVDFFIQPTLLQNSSTPERQLLIENFVKTNLAHNLGMPLETIWSAQKINELGIDSLMSAQLTCTIEQAMGVVLPPSTFLHDLTIESLVNRLSEEFSNQKASLLPDPKQIGNLDNESFLSSNQKAQWFLSQLDPDSVAANVAVVLLISQPFDQSAAHGALKQVIQHHPILRTIYEVQSGIPFQRVLPCMDISIERTSVINIDWKEVKKSIIATSQKPFDLSQPPLFRAHLFERSPSSALLLLNTHHIAADGWSMHLLVDDFIQAYSGKSVHPKIPNSEPTKDYINFSRWQAQLLDSPEGQRLWKFWKNQLPGEIPRLHLTHRQTEPLLATPRTNFKTFSIPSELTTRLQCLAKNEGVTLYVILLAGFQVLLHRYTRQKDILICTPMSGRIRPEYLKTVGNFTNTVMLRETFDGNPTFSNLLRQVSQTVTDAIDHQIYPYALLIERLRSQHHRSPFPTGQILFVLQNFSLFDDLNDPLTDLPIRESGTKPDSKTGNIDSFVIPQPTGQFDLTLELAERGTTLSGHAEFNCDLFDPPFIERLVDHFLIILESLSKAPKNRILESSFLKPHERHRLLVEWNPPQLPLIHQTSILELIENQVEEFPDRVALVSNGAELTYEKLNKRANQVAYILKENGVGPDRPVGICIDRSIEMIIAILAILKANGCYVPLDPNSPKARLAIILQDVSPSHILTSQRLKHVLSDIPATLFVLDEYQDEIARQPVTNLIHETEPQNLAYVIYTSGSTGKPKGVQIEHQSLIAFAKSFQHECGLREGDRVLQFASLAFDASVEEIFPFLSSGGTIVLPQEMILESPDRFLEKCCELNISILDLPTAYWQELALHLEKQSTSIYSSLRLMIIGGEEASRRAVQVWHSNVSPSIRLVNTYGPTEATVSITACDLTKIDSDEQILFWDIPIGRALSHGQTYILDQFLQPVPIGIPGELYLGGQSIARGYHNHFDDTARFFIPNPFSKEKGTRLFRTGDICRYRPDGLLEYLGRTDSQVKIRGFRVELHEIEAVMEEHQGIYEALVVLDKNTPSAPRLIAYFIPVRQPGLPARELRAFLKERLPEFMIPAAFMSMNSWPHTTTGKIDRSKLPQVSDTQWESEEQYEAPRGPIEQSIAQWYCEILGLTRVGIRDHFFELGGHSLLAVQLVSRLREMFRCDIPLRLFFENPTVAGLAETIQSILQGKTGKEVIPSIIPAPKDRPLPLSSSQERIYFLHKLAPQSAAYNIPVAIRLQGQLNKQALEESLNQLIQRHESLRTSMHEESGTPYQVISEISSVKLKHIDLRQVPRSLRLEKAHEKADEEVRRPFDLATAPLLRMVLLQMTDDDHVLTLTVHHIVSDQWSFAILGKELGQFYNTLCHKNPIQAEPLPLQYADFACWQREWLTSKVLENQYSYWTNKLATLPLLKLPTNYPRLPEQTFTGTYITIDLSKPLLNKLQKLSATENATLYMLCLAAFKVLLNRYSGQTDIVIGSPVANRHWLSVENMVGTFVNTLVLRTDLSGDPTFRELLQRVRHVALEGYANQDLPFEKLVQDLAPARTLGSMPLVQVLFNFGNAPFERVKFTGVSLRPFEIDRGASQFDLSLSIDPMFSGKAILEFNTDLFDDDHMRHLLAHYQELLQSIVASPDDPISSLNMLTHAEKQQILVEWNITDAPFPRQLSALDLFENQVKNSPESLAVISDKAMLTYDELNERAARLALCLRRLRVGPDILVGVAVDRTADLLVVLLGIMKAGGAYLPLDPQGPPERLAFMLQNSQAPILITQLRLIKDLPDYHGTIFHLDDDIDRNSDERNPDSTTSHRIAPTHLAYTIYTSGSTGQPKGVEVEQRSLVNFLHSMSRKLAVTHADVFLAVTPITFDIAALELFLPLSVGARVMLVSAEEARDGQRLIERIRISGATVMQATPSTWRMLLQMGWQGNKNLKILSGGEALTREIAEELLKRSREVWNLFGPTETTIWSTVQKVRSGKGPISIGRPIDNTRIFILDKNSQIAPVGIPGDLYIGGEGVARGYLGRPDLTAERFQQNPFGWPEERLYKTGDIAKWRPDGSLEYMGRDDHQVKIRGVRIELQEIEAQLNQIPEIHQAVVLVIETTQSDQKLVAYLVASTDSTLDIDQIRTRLRASLPHVMVPSEFVCLSELPLTPNGKIDRNALPAPEGSYPELNQPFVVPTTPTEEVIAEIWAEVLELPRVGIYDNFFELGGHSLLANQVMARIRTRLQINLSLTPLFENPTVAGLAHAVQKAQNSREGGVSSEAKDLSELLDSLDSLTDEEAQALVDQETNKKKK